MQQGQYCLVLWYSALQWDKGFSTGLYLPSTAKRQFFFYSMCWKTIGLFFGLLLVTNQRSTPVLLWSFYRESWRRKIVPDSYRLTTEMLLCLLQSRAKGERFRRLPRSNPNSFHNYLCYFSSLLQPARLFYLTKMSQNVLQKFNFLLWQKNSNT